MGEDRLDRGPEWRVYDGDERERTGAPLTPARHDNGLSTEIGYGTDAHGTALSGRKRQQLGRLRREHNRGRWRSKAEQNLAHGLTDVRRITSALELPNSIRDQACALFRSAQQTDLLRGRSIDGFAAASVYAVCRCNGLPRTQEEVEQYARCDRSTLKNAYKTLNVEFDLPTPPPMPRDFVSRLASDLDVSKQVRHRALELARQAEEAGITSGCKPTAFAAACLYTAARERGESLTQNEVASVADTTAVTVRTIRIRLRSYIASRRLPELGERRGR